MFLEVGTHANSLATLATSSAQDLPRVVLVEDLYTQTSVHHGAPRIHQITLGPSWMDSISLFLEKDVLPEEKSEADKVRRKAPWFWLSEDRKLYKRSFFGPYLLCVHLEASESLLKELHMKGFVEVIQEENYYLTELLPKGIGGQTCKKKTQEYVKKCDQCQRYAPNIHQPGRVLNPLSSPWPFAQWSLDIVGPFPKAVGNKKYLLVCTDYFTKWVEAEPLANIRDVDVKRFIWKNIVTRFGVPNVLISDNGLQFDSKAFRKYCSDLGIKNRYSTLAYLQGNG